MTSEINNVDFKFSKAGAGTSPISAKKKAVFAADEKEQKKEIETPVLVHKNEDKSEQEQLPEKPKFDPEELMAIFDEILFTGEYTESVSIKGKLNVVFRTRTSGETEEITRALDGLGANLFATLEQKRARLNLQYSLVRYHNKDLSGVRKEEKEAFLDKLPTAISLALINALSSFDEKVFEACKEAEEGF